MTPQERQLIEDLFDRLARLENTPRDAEAERAIAEGVRRAPNAIYPLVQTVLVQDEALRRADARIRELTGEEPAAPAGGGFLDSMRAMLSGRPASTSVPSVRAPAAADPRYAAPPVPPSAGRSFLGTAAASAAGVIGGALLLNSIGSLFGGHRANASPFDAGAGGGWGHDAGNDLPREAAFDDNGNDLGDSADPRGDFGDFGGDGGGIDT